MTQYAPLTLEAHKTKQNNRIIERKKAEKKIFKENIQKNSLKELNNIVE